MCAARQGAEAMLLVVPRISKNARSRGAGGACVHECSDECSSVHGVQQASTTTPTRPPRPSPPPHPPCVLPRAAAALVRYTCVALAGVVTEYLRFDVAEGGLGDVQGLDGLFRALQVGQRSWGQGVWACACGVCVAVCVCACVLVRVRACMVCVCGGGGRRRQEGGVWLPCPERLAHASHVYAQPPRVLPPRSGGSEHLTPLGR